MAQEHVEVYSLSSVPTKRELLHIINASLQTRLVNDYLVKVDRASMYAFVEMRSPFLDKDLAQFASTLRVNQLYYNREPKAILKTILLKDFSKDFVNRRKMGFVFPLMDFFVGHARVVEETIMACDYPFEMNKRVLKEKLAKLFAGDVGQIHKVFSLYVLARWLEGNKHYLQK